MSFYPIRALSAVLCFAAWQAQAQVPPFVSVHTAGGTRLNSGNGIVLDGMGNFYVAGSFGSPFQTGSIDFGVTNLVSRGDSDGFLAKFNALGQCLWARQMGGIDDDDAYDVILRSDGSVLVMGEFAGTNTIAGTNLVSQGGYDIFLAAFSASGDLLWARGLGGAMDEFAIAITAGPNGGALFTGSFAGSIQLDAFSFTSADEDALLLSLNANGGVQWANRARGAGSQFGTDAKYDAQGNVYWAGQFETNAVLGGTTLTSPGDNVFIAKYNSAGIQLWARKLGQGDEAQFPRIAMAADGRLLCSAVYRGSYSIDTQVLPTGVDDFVITSFNAADALQWVNTSAGNELESCIELLVDASGDCYLMGHFRGTMTIGNTNLSSAGNTDIFVARYSPSGQFQGAAKGGGSGPDLASAGALGGAGEIRLTGSFSTTAQFGSISVTTSDSFAKAFVTTLSPPPTLRITSFPAHVLLSWPGHLGAATLQTKSELSAPSWTPVTAAPVLLNGELVVTNQVSDPKAFFRLGN